MPDRVPSVFLLFPGPWKTPEEVIESLGEAGIAASPAREEPIAQGEVRVDLVSHTPGFGAAVSHGRAGLLPDSVIDAAHLCIRAALLQVGATFHADSKKLARIGRALADGGAVAVRVEASGCATTLPDWITLLEDGDPMDLIRCAVIIVGDDDDSLFTCGMHAFDLPEVQIRLDDPQEAIVWLDTLCAFQIAEQPVLGTGHTFRPDADAERHRLERWPDHRHDPDDGRHNPFGVWRLVPDGPGALEALNPVPVIMPSLFALLTAAEEQKGAPLTRDEVERLTNEAPSMAMDPKDIATLERSRGYADLEPRRVWEQWVLVREDR